MSEYDDDADAPAVPTDDVPSPQAAEGQPESALDRLRRRAAEARTAGQPPAAAREGARPPLGAPQSEAVAGVTGAEPVTEAEPATEAGPAAEPDSAEAEPATEAVPAAPPDVARGTRTSPRRRVPGPDGPAAAPAGTPPRRRRRLPVVVAVLVVAVIAAAVVLVLLQRSRSDDKALAADRAAATAAARQLVTDVTHLDYRNLDDWLRRVQADAGPGLREDFTVRRAGLDVVLAGSQLVSMGEVKQATVLVAGSTATSLVFVQSRTATRNVPAGRIVSDRYQLKLQKLDDRWVPVGLDLVPSEPAL